MNKLIKLYQWLPIIWKDEDWDYAFLLKLIKYKLSRMEKVIGSGKSPAAHWEHRKVEIATAQLLLSKIDDDPDDEWNTHYNQWHIGSKECGDKAACKIALMFSSGREEGNWHHLWTYLDQNMRNWWD